MNEISVDQRTLWFTLILSVLSGLFLGMVPVFRYAGPRISVALQSAGRTASASRERLRARNILVVAQIAIALVLLVSAGLMIRTAQALRTVVFRIHRRRASSNQWHLDSDFCSFPIPNLAVRIQNNLADKLSAIPGVTSVGFAGEVPMEGEPPNWDNVFPGRQSLPRQRRPLCGASRTSFPHSCTPLAPVSLLTAN